MRRALVWLRGARSMSAPQVAARAMMRLGVKARWVRRLDLLHGQGAQSPTRIRDLLLSALERAGAPANAFEQRLREAVVLEVGCGQHGGLGPVCAAAGARAYHGIDPAMDPALFEDAAVRTGWLAPGLKQVASNATAETLLNRFDACCHYHASPLDALTELDEQCDLFVSVSCLEHIADLGAAVAVMRRLSAPGAQHVHLVNFANHTDRGRPFHGLYQMPLPAYLKQWGGHINGYRASDLGQMFKTQDVAVQVVPLDVPAESLPDDVHPWWLERYTREELAVRTALVVTPAMAPAHSDSAQEK
jgi:hypothetical protein